MNNDIKLRWNNVTVVYDDPKKTKRIILENVSGCAKSSSLIAIMGPSGAGKTTLLGALSGRIRVHSGLITINNEPVTRRIKNSFGYLHQEDILTDSLTAVEHLKFMSALKLHASRREKENIVENLLRDLNLDYCKETKIRDLSGGEKRKVSIATELLSSPQIIFCDEPTTGLDSFGAAGVIEVLHNLSLQGKLVMITVHQPSSQIFDYFTNVILLSDGQLVFQGSKFKMAAFFAGADLPCPDNYNPADFYVKCVSIREDDQESVARRNFLLKHSRNLSVSRDWEHVKQPNGFNVFRFKRRNSLVQLYWLLWKGIIASKRNFSRHLYHFSLLMATAVLIGMVYSGTNTKDIYNVQNLHGLLFVIASELIFTHMYNVMYTFPEECAVCLREKHLYSSFTYFTSKLLLTIPHCVIQPTLFVTIIHLFFNFTRNLQHFLQICFVAISAATCATTLGLSLSALCDSLAYMELFAVPFELLGMLVSGVWINVATIPAIFAWIKYVSPFFYSYEAMSIIQWSEDISMDCDVICYDSGRSVLEANGFDGSKSYIEDVVSMMVLSLVFCVLGFLGIVRKRRNV